MKTFSLLLLIAALSVSLLGCDQKTKEEIREEQREIIAQTYAEHPDDYWENIPEDHHRVNEECVYWVPNGKSYHSVDTCIALINSNTILSGTLDEAESEGKDDPCSKCVGD